MLEFNQAKLDAFCAEHKLEEYPPWVIYPPRGNYYHNSQVVVNNAPVALLLIGDDWMRCFEANVYFQDYGYVTKRCGANQTLSDVCTSFEADCLQLKAKTSILCAGYQDVVRFLKEHAGQRIGEADTFSFLGKLRFQFRGLIKQARAVNQTLWLASVPPVFGDATTNELIQRVNSVISSVCDEFDTKYVDFY